jgi:predicted transcriptional regulator
MLEKIQQRGATMAFWNKKQDDFETMDSLIQQQPGISQAQIAQQLEVQRSTVSRRLPSMEEAGFLYYEDDVGGLWPFKKNS